MISHPIGRTPIGPVQTAPTVPAAGTLDPVLRGLAQLAAGASGSPLASIAIAGRRGTWCPATAPLAAAALPRLDPFAVFTSHAALLFEVADATLDHRFRECELVTGPFAIRSYAGFALRTPGGATLGSLAVYGSQARALSPEQRATLLLLCEQAVARTEAQARLTELALLSDAPPTASAALLERRPATFYHPTAAG